ncbi:MAG TPA: hypothetical protein VF421_06945 [Niabella sp.]
MRIFDNFSLTEDAVVPVLFTGNAIAHLSSVTAPINISEWQSYEAIINGCRTLIITDKILQPDTKGLVS